MFFMTNLKSRLLVLSSPFKVYFYPFFFLFNVLNLFFSSPLFSFFKTHSFTHTHSSPFPLTFSKPFPFITVTSSLVTCQLNKDQP